MLACLSPKTGFHFWETCDGLIQTAKQKGRPDNPSGLFLNANAQTPAWPLLASPPPDFCFNARNVHDDTVSLPLQRLQLENSHLGRSIKLARFNTMHKENPDPVKRPDSPFALNKNKHDAS